MPHDDTCYTVFMRNCIANTDVVIETVGTVTTDKEFALGVARRLAETNGFDAIRVDRWYGGTKVGVEFQSPADQPIR